jgi:hypothetical protein
MLWKEVQEMHRTRCNFLDESIANRLWIGLVSLSVSVQFAIAYAPETKHYK